MKVFKEQCQNCLLSPDAIVSPARIRGILKECRQQQTHFICHKASMKGEETVCAEWYRTQGPLSQMVRIAQRLGVVEFVEQEDQEKLEPYARRRKED